MSINAWANDQGALFAVPMTSAMPPDPSNGSWLLQWDPILRQLKYAPFVPPAPEFDLPVPYVGGLAMTVQNQTVEYAGTVYAPVLGTLPFITTGIWATDSAKFRIIQGATQAEVQAWLALKAPVASPVLTGRPLAPTAVTTTNDDQIATTAYVKAQFNAGSLGINGINISNTLTLPAFGAAIATPVSGSGYVDWAGPDGKPLIETTHPPANLVVWWLRHVAPGDAYTAAIGCIAQSLGANIRMQLPGAYFDFTTGGAALKPGGGSWADTSDERTKQNIEPWATGLHEVMQLKVRRWNFRKETGRDVAQEFVGLVAQEAELVAPRLVSTQAGEMGELKFDDLRSVDPSDLPYMLLNSVQEQQRMIEALQVRIAALESKQ